MIDEKRKNELLSQLSAVGITDRNAYTFMSALAERVRNLRIVPSQHRWFEHGALGYAVLTFEPEDGQTVSLDICYRVENDRFSVSFPGPSGYTSPAPFVGFAGANEALASSDKLANALSEAAAGRTPNPRRSVPHGPGKPGSGT